jgi:hypothetical protein
MAKTSFNYESLKDAKVAKQARESAKQIRLLLQKTAESVVQIGKLMATVRDGMTPVTFLAWVECEFGWVQSVASNYMQAAEKFNDLDCLKQIQPTAIIRLSRKNVPESVINDAVAKARAGEMVTASMVNRMLVAAGHKPTHASAGKPRKPASARSIAHASTASVEQLTSSLDELSRNIGAMTLAQTEREALAAKFFEMAMSLRMPVATEAPAKPAAKGKTSSKAPAAPVAAPEPEVKVPAPAKTKPTGKSGRKPVPATV